MRIKGIKIDEDVARILNEQDNDDTSIFETRGSGWVSLYDYVSKAFDRLAAGYSHPSQVPDFLQTRDLLEKLTKYELKLAKLEFLEKDLQAALDRWFEEADDYTNESINEEVLPHNINKVKRLIDRINKNGYFKIDGEDISINKGFGTVGEQIDLQTLAEQFEELGFRVRTTHFHITVYGLNDFIEKQNNKNEYMKEGFNKEANNFPEGSFAAWYGEDLTGQTYEGDLDCSYNKLTSLLGCPSVVTGNFNCSYNQLTSLEGASKEVGGDFNCSYNQLTSLEGAPQEVKWSFYCSDNRLTSLEGAPKEVGGVFDCTNNNLTSLKGAPKEVEAWFDCSNNPNLKSLDGIGEVKGNIISDID